MDTIEPLRKPLPVTEVPETPRMLHKLGRARKSLETSNDGAPRPGQSAAEIKQRADGDPIVVTQAQALNMLRRLGLDDLPDDAVEWALVGIGD